MNLNTNNIMLLIALFLMNRSLKQYPVRSGLTASGPERELLPDGRERWTCTAGTKRDDKEDP